MGPDFYIKLVETIKGSFFYTFISLYIFMIIASFAVGAFNDGNFLKVLLSGAIISALFSFKIIMITSGNKTQPEQTKLAMKTFLTFGIVAILTVFAAMFIFSILPN